MSKPLWAIDDARIAAAAEAARVAKAAANLKRRRDLAASLTSFTESAKHGTYGTYGWAGGSRVNKSLYDALRVAAFLSGWGNLVITQGGLNGTAVRASANTHVGLDVADVMSRGRSLADIKRFVHYAMLCGVIGFIRGSADDNIADGMVPHIHFVRVGAPQAHPDARAQIYNKVYGYAYGGAGLAGLPSANWFGPDREPLVLWADSKYNPKNGWLPA